MYKRYLYWLIKDGKHIQANRQKVLDLIFKYRNQITTRHKIDKVEYYVDNNLVAVQEHIVSMGEF